MTVLAGKTYRGHDGRILAFSLLGIAILFAMAQVVGVPFSHDEHQFVAGGRLTSLGLLPYRDFPFHHLPNQIYVQGVLQRLIPGSLWASRSISGLAAIGTILFMGFLAWTELRELRRRDRVILSLLPVMVLLSTHLFAYTSGRAWNHDLPTFLTLLACGLTLQFGRNRAASSTWLVVGLLTGFAAGSRMTYSLTFPVFGLAILAWSPAPRRHLLLLAGGALVGVGPSLALAAIDPIGFWFGNVQYARLNTEYRLLLGHWGGMTLPGKARYFLMEVAIRPLQAAIFLGWGAAIVGDLVQRRRGTRRGLSASSFLGLIGLALTLGAITPTPVWVQYFYAPLPFALVAAVIVLGHWIQSRSRLQSTRIALSALFLVLAPFGVSLRERVQILADPASWVPVRSAHLGSELAERITSGRVLTLAPTFALEAGLEIEPRLATGPFTWRVTPLLPQEVARRERLLLPIDLESGAYASDITAVLLGLEEGKVAFADNPARTIEDPLQRYAELKGFHPAAVDFPELPEGSTLWTVPRP